jgi:hypothetical protein
MKDNGAMTGHFRISQFEAGTIERPEDGKMTAEQIAKYSPVNAPEWEKNRIVLSEGYGANLIMKHLGNDTSLGPIAIDHVGLGTGATAITAGDNVMEAELVNVPVESWSVVDGVLTMALYIEDANMPNATYTRIALKIGTRMFTHAVCNYVKLTGKDTTLEYVITLNPLP